MAGLGTELKLNLNITPLGDIHAEDFNFYAEFFTNSFKKLKVEKSQMIKVDADNYICTINTNLIGCGTLLYRVRAEVPDLDMTDGFRTEQTETLCTNIAVRK